MDPFEKLPENPATIHDVPKKYYNIMCYTVLPFVANDAAFEHFGKYGLKEMAFQHGLIKIPAEYHDALFSSVWTAQIRPGRYYRINFRTNERKLIVDEFVENLYLKQLEEFEREQKNNSNEK